MNLNKLVKTTVDFYSTESKGLLKNFDFSRQVTISMSLDGANKTKIVQNSLYFQDSRNPRYVAILFSLKKFLIILLAVFLAACTTQIKEYASQEPKLNLKQFFNGKLKAYGMVMNWKGKVIRRFSVDMDASWDNNVGILDETFLYDDGEVQKRIWTLNKKNNGQYIGTANDVLGKAQGQTAGFALNWQYTLQIPIDGETWHIDFNDWMYQLDEKRIINQADMKKWGFKVGEVLLWIEKID